MDQIVENWQRADLKPFELSDALAELRDQHRLTQDDIARLTGKPKSEISRLLSIQKVAPAIQQQARTTEAGKLSRRHLIAVAQLPADEQPEFVDKIRAGQLSATESEREAARWKQSRTGEPTRGSRSTVRRYLVGPATVQITFRKRQVTDDDVLDVSPAFPQPVPPRTSRNASRRVRAAGRFPAAGQVREASPVARNGRSSIGRPAVGIAAGSETRAERADPRRAGGIAVGAGRRPETNGLMRRRRPAWEGSHRERD